MILKRWITKGFIFVAVCLPPCMSSPARELAVEVDSTDSRLSRIRSFFKKRKCPAERYAAEFLKAADKHRLDWRLLPSLALVESGGGKAYKNNNIFGWDSCRYKFPSVKAGIHTVAERLANAPVYRRKSLDEKLKTYNRNPQYGRTVKSVMGQLAAEPVI